MVNDECKIDSLQLFLPMDKVTLNNQDYYTTLEINKATGEIEKEKEPFIKFNDRGASVGIKVGVKPMGRGSMGKGVSISIPSKILGSDYFDGINKDNIRKVHGYINSVTDDFNVSMENFLKARASDIDFCLDGTVLSDNDFKVFSKELSKMCQAVGIKHYNPKKKGEYYIQTRKTATNTTPFSKIYQKLVEYDGSEHQKAFFPDVSLIPNSTRAEVTLKNQEMIRNFSSGGIRSSTFLHVLEGNYSNIVPNVFKHYFSKSAKQINPKMNKPVDKLKPLPMMFYCQLLHELQSIEDRSKVNELELIDLIYNRNTIAIPTTKSRILRDRRKQITEIYKAYFGANNDQRISEFNSYMKNIGLMN